MTLDQMRTEIKRSTTRQLQQWLADCERRHPEMINTEAMLKDEIRKRDQRRANDLFRGFT